MTEIPNDEKYYVRPRDNRLPPIDPEDDMEMPPEVRADPAKRAAWLLWKQRADEEWDFWRTQ